MTRGRVFKRGRWYWLAYYSNGKEYREPARTTKQGEAQRFLAKRLAEVASGAFIGTAAERVTVDELLRDLTTDYEVRGHASIGTLKSHLPPLREQFGPDRAVSITTARFQDAVKEWQRAGTAPATINRRLTSLKRAYSLAVTGGKINRAPVFPAKLPELNARQGFFERAEFLAVAAKLEPDLRDLAEWCFVTGMRKGEATRLTWAGFDRETWTLRLHARDAKTRVGRVIPLTAALRAVIERRLAARRLDCQLIFHREGEPIRDIRKAWANACKAAGLAGRLFHDFRRTGVRNLVRAGVSQTVAMAISGHRTASVFRRYDITNEADIAAALERVSNYLEQLPDEPIVLPLAASAGRRRLT